MPNVPAYGDAPDVEQDLKTSTSMLGSNQVQAPEAWGGAFEKTNDAAEDFAKPKPTAADVLYGGGKSTEPKPKATFVSDRDWDYVATVREDYDNARRANDSAKFREALNRVGGTLRSYPHLEPHLPQGAAQAYRDYRGAIDDDERQNFIINGLNSTPDDRDRMAQSAAAAVLRAAIPPAGANSSPDKSATDRTSRVQYNRHVQSGEWWYNQRTGDLDYVDDAEVIRRMGTGYSGRGAGLNNPDMQHVRDTGPIPRGVYRIGRQQDNPINDGRTTLRNSMWLTPDGGNAMHGRSGFLLHSDNNRRDRTASTGCIVLPRHVLNRIGASGVRRLRVY